MKVFFKKSFLKDFQKLPEEIKKETREICVFIFPEIKDLREFQIYPIKKLKGFKDYYRIKVRNFRIGFKKKDNEIVFMKVLHRKDIYRYFPKK